jgi:Terminase large subunit, T4likevirus-type, N-terminal
MAFPFAAAIAAQPGPQSEFLRSRADICIYGGAAGGGKTAGLILEPLRHVGWVVNFTAVFFRRTMPQITNPGALWDESLNFYPRLGGTPHLRMREWRWPRGGKIKFSHLQFETTVYDWQGAQITLICFDELTHFSAHQFFYMVSRNRSTCGVRPYIRATCNPDADSWVAEFLAWWIDPESGLPIPERAGLLRYFIRVAEKIVWADRPGELMEDLLRGQDLPPGIDPPLPMSVTFIPATVFDNPALLRVNPEYLAWLLSLPILERERLLGGNWKIRPAAGLYFRREWCAVVDAIPADLDMVRYWDLAATEKTEFNDPDWTVSSSAVTRTAATGYWIWCGREPTRAMSNDCCAISPSRTAKRSASGLAKIRGKPARARHFIWCAPLAASRWSRPRRAATSLPGLDHSARSAAPIM